MSGDAGRTLTLLLDTGSTHTVIDPQSLARITDRKIDLDETFRFEALHLGDAVFRNAPGWVVDLDRIAWALGTEIDGILGYPTLAGVVLTLDYAAREVRVATGDDARLPREGSWPMKGGRRRPWIDLDVDGKEVTVLLDSGSSRGFSLREDDGPWQRPPREVGALAGFEGVETVRVARLASTVSVGPVAFSTPAVRILDAGEIPSLGAKVLERFVVTIDGPGRRIRFEPIDDEESVPASPYVGLGVGWEAHADRLGVLVVTPDGPGDRAGLRAGDRVTAVDGVPVPEMPGCGEALAGDEIRLTVRRGDALLPDVIVRRDVLVP